MNNNQLFDAVWSNPELLSNILDAAFEQAVDSWWTVVAEFAALRLVCRHVPKRPDDPKRTSCHLDCRYKGF